MTFSRINRVVPNVGTNVKIYVIFRETFLNPFECFGLLPPRHELVPPPFFHSVGHADFETDTIDLILLFKENTFKRAFKTFDSDALRQNIRKALRIGIQSRNLLSAIGM